MTDYVVVLVTASSAEEARRIGETLVAERLAACANLIGGVCSIFRWDDKVEEAAEHLIVLKARRADVDALAARVCALHSYEVPEVIAVPIVAGAASYLAWLGASTDRRA